MIGNKKLSLDETAAFCSQLGMILRAGISAMEGLGIMLEESGDKGETEILQTLQDTLMTTGSFAEGVRASGVFPAYCEKMIAIGESAGRLDEVMEALGTHYQREASIRGSIRSVLTYSTVMILMMLLVVVVLLVQVLPVFQMVFRQLGSEMTGFSAAMLRIGDGLKSNGIVIAVVLAVLIAAAALLLRTPKGRSLYYALTARLFGGDSYQNLLAVCRFAGGMALTLKSGIGPEESLDYAAELTGNETFNKKIAAAKEELANGTELATALVKAGIFTGMFGRMAAVGTRTGLLDDTMQKIADANQEKVDRRLAALIAAIEPVMVVLLSAVVGVILLSVMLPLVDIMSSL